MRQTSCTKRIPSRRIHKRNCNFHFYSSYATSDNFKLFYTQDSFYYTSEPTFPLRPKLYHKNLSKYSYSPLLLNYRKSLPKKCRNSLIFPDVIIRKRNKSKMETKDYCTFVNLTKCTQVRKRRLIQFKQLSNTKTKEESEHKGICCKPITEGCIIIKKRL